MERLPLYCQDQRRGEVALALWGPNGARTEIAAQMDDPGDGLYRAFHSRFLIDRLRPAGRGWWRREGSVLLLALPLEEGKPFPLEALFCLGRIQRVEGSRCVVYAFREEEPVFWREG